MQAFQAEEQRQPSRTPEEKQQRMLRSFARMEAFDLDGAAALWGTSAADFYAVTGVGRVVHVRGEDATIVYDAACAEPAADQTNPVCQGLKK